MANVEQKIATQFAAEQAALNFCSIHGRSSFCVKFVLNWLRGGDVKIILVVLDNNFPSSLINSVFSCTSCSLLDAFDLLFL